MPPHTSGYVRTRTTIVAQTDQHSNWYIDQDCIPMVIISSYSHLLEGYLPRVVTLWSVVTALSASCKRQAMCTWPVVGVRRLTVCGICQLWPTLVWPVVSELSLVSGRSHTNWGGNRWPSTKQNLTGSNTSGQAWGLYSGTNPKVQDTVIGEQVRLLGSHPPWILACDHGSAHGLTRNLHMD